MHSSLTCTYIININYSFKTKFIYLSDWDPFEFADVDNIELRDVEILETIGNISNSRGSKNSRKSIDKTEKSYPCPNCSSVYNRHDNLTQHLKYVCFQEPRFACPYCNYVTKRTYNVYGHVRSRHANERVGYIDLADPNKLITPQNGR